MEFDIGMTINPNPVSDSVGELVVVAIITIGSNDFQFFLMFHIFYFSSMI